MCPQPVAYRVDSLNRLTVAVCCSSLLLLAGCLSIVGISERDVHVSITLQRAWDPPPSLQVYIDGRRVEIDARSDGRRAEREVQASRSGELLVGVRLLNADKDTLAATQFLQRFDRRNSHWIALTVGPQRPIGHCIGNLLALALPSESDTAFVMYGRIPDGAIC
jgi:hypothetical protein